MKFWSDNLKGIGKSEDLEVDNMRTDLREIGWEDVDWTHQALDRDQWRDFANTTMNLKDS
jgi:hypothetical protein